MMNSIFIVTSTVDPPGGAFTLQDPAQHHDPLLPVVMFFLFCSMVIVGVLFTPSWVLKA